MATATMIAVSPRSIVDRRLDAANTMTLSRESTIVGRNTRDLMYHATLV